MLCLCAAQLKFWFQTNLARKNSASYLEIQAGKTFSCEGHALVTLYVTFDALIGQNLTGEFMRKIYAASWILFTLTAEADRVLCQLVMFLCLFLLDVQKWNTPMLSRVFCCSWLVCLLVVWLRDASLVKVGNQIWDGIVFVFHLAWKVWSDTGLTRYLSGAASRMVSLSNVVFV